MSIYKFQVGKRALLIKPGESFRARVDWGFGMNALERATAELVSEATWAEVSDAGYKMNETGFLMLARSYYRHDREFGIWLKLLRHDAALQTASLLMAKYLSETEVPKKRIYWCLLQTLSPETRFAWCCALQEEIGSALKVHVTGAKWEPK
jgi:hypothetical protein